MKKDIESLEESKEIPLIDKFELPQKKEVDLEESK